MKSLESSGFSGLPKAAKGIRAGEGDQRPDQLQHLLVLVGKRVDSHHRGIQFTAIGIQGTKGLEGGERGVYKTTDGGATWQQVLAISPHTGANEVHLVPRDSDVAYASAYQRRRRVWTLIDLSLIHISEPTRRS